MPAMSVTLCGLPSATVFSSPLSVVGHVFNVPECVESPHENRAPRVFQQALKGCKEV